MRCVCCGQVTLLEPYAPGSPVDWYPGQEAGPTLVHILQLCSISGGVILKNLGKCHCFWNASRGLGLG